MPSLLIDEDLPRSHAPAALALRSAGFAAEDVRDVGLRGQSDEQVFDYAQAHDQVLVTADMGFANILRFPPGTHAGIVVLRVPGELPTSAANRELLRALTDLAREDLTGLLVIVEVGRTRLHRPRRVSSD
ncbi:MAG TPA: DUF5615 family PIN-like protein [Mycobacteriales bacterium]|nr:DUF5615 family PIN-like protein [Mycobacteriales bacterium]